MTKVNSKPVLSKVEWIINSQFERPRGPLSKPVISKQNSSKKAPPMGQAYPFKFLVRTK